MRLKLLILGLLASSLLGYLEWGGDQNGFLGQIEWNILSKLVTNPGSVLHPLTILPMIGQLLFITALFKPQKWILITGMGCIGILMVLLLIIGLMSLNWKIALSPIPFLLLCYLTLRRWPK